MCEEYGKDALNMISKVNWYSVVNSASLDFACIRCKAADFSQPVLVNFHSLLFIR